MNQFFVITNSSKDRDFETTNRIREYLESRGKKCLIPQNQDNELGSSYRFTNPNYVPDDTDCLIVLGGDGTLLQAARDLVGKEIPLIGVNLGKLGYLAEIEKHAIENMLEHLIQDEFQVESRMMLDGKIIRDGTLVTENIALNDIVVNRSGALRIIDFKLYVNGQFLNLYTADGFIISTPTGSTAYNLSAGGPIVSPSAEVMILTPICAHTIMHSRSIVLSAEDQIEIVICSDRNSKSEERIVAFDGDSMTHLKTDDRIVVRKSNLSTKIIKLSTISFLETLRKKMIES